VFAFDSVVNRLFQHGVPRGKKSSGPRFSIIAWGRRRHINERNGGEIGCEPLNNMMIRNLTFDDRGSEKENTKTKDDDETNGLLKIKSKTLPLKTNESVEVDLMSIVNDFCKRVEKHRRRTTSSSSNTRREKKHFKSKNVQLLKQLKRELSSNQLKAFKTCAKSFQSNKISANEFIEKCRNELQIDRAILIKALRILPNAEKKEKAMEALGRYC